ncbi:MAG: YkgJ family cysteine cluster protein [Phycisphaerales bacterium]|nr:YkgJ family cysteine cluster protein [Phycisphaerales bacterium]
MMDDPVRDPWYQGGLQFSCTQCGNCCTGAPGAVWFTEEEGRAMAAQVSLSEQEFLDGHTRLVGSRRSLKEIETSHGFDCAFLDRDSVPGKALCRIYRARPSQCRTWPFWPTNLSSRRAWEQARAATPCPGMGAGALVRVEEIRIMRDQDQLDNGSAPW